MVAAWIYLLSTSFAFFLTTKRIDNLHSNFNFSGARQIISTRKLERQEDSGDAFYALAVESEIARNNSESFKIHNKLTRITSKDTMHSIIHHSTYKIPS